MGRRLAISAPRCSEIPSTTAIGVSRSWTDGASIEIATFSGDDARQRAIRYAEREYGAFDEIELEPYARG